MRTAFCFSGELRSIDKTYSILKERLMSRFSNYDIFYHSWSDDPDISKLSFIENDSNTKNILIENRKIISEDILFYKNKRDEVNVQGFLRQLYCLKKSNELKINFEKENNFKYDIVIRIRPDIFILNNTSLENGVESWDMLNYVYTSDHDDHHGYNDRFYFSNSSNMDFLSNRINLVEEYTKLGGIFHYETFFKFCINYQNLEVCRTRLEFGLLRTNGAVSTDLIHKTVEN